MLLIQKRKKKDPARLPLPAAFDNREIRSPAPTQDAAGSSFPSSLSFFEACGVGFLQFHLFSVRLFPDSHGSIPPP